MSASLEARLDALETAVAELRALLHGVLDHLGEDQVEVLEATHEGFRDRSRARDSARSEP